MAPSQKRKARAAPVEDDAGSDSEGSSYSEVPYDSTDEVDISGALIGSLSKAGDNAEESDDEEFIKTHQEKMNLKAGTEALKKVGKGAAKASKGKGVVGGGSFQSMGLHPSLLRSLLMRGYKTPTPIQRASIPSLLSTPPRDLVGMARTGSGKTLAYMIPLIQRLGGRHATTFGARALVLIPARELALQILKVGKELARGWSGGGGGEHAGDAEVDEQAEAKKSQALRWGLVVGGEGLDEQFEMITSNPDVIIATPGRLLHLIVEMNLDLKSVQYVVFDEADRLFELGFSTALHEILHKLPTSRQTLLFSATLPKTLVEFAKAGLQNPKLVRLDAESKISSDLRMAFFSVKQAEKDACLLSLLRDVIKVPQDGNNRRDVSEEDEDDSKRKQGKGKAKEIQTAPHQTLVFVATKHHVEYVSNLVSTAGYSVSYIYGALDQTARGLQMDRFRRGLTSVLVVTDVAARGIDIPVLENVVNYDFPQGARVFVHRVGRTARAGRKGWAWSFITNSELPHLLDLQLFLDRPLTTKASDGEMAYTENLVLGTFKRATVDEDVEYIRVLDEKNGSLPTLREVMRRGQGMYERSMGKASPASYKRAKEMVKSGRWGLTGSAGEEGTVHPVLSKDDEEGKADEINLEEARQAMIQAVNSFRPNETIFEVGSRGKTPAALLMKDRRKSLSKAIKRTVVDSPAVDDAGDGDVDALEREGSGQVLELADEDDLEAVFGSSSRKKARKEKVDYKDSEFYMSHYQKDAMTNKGYSLQDGASFAEQASKATFDLTTDEAVSSRQRHSTQLSWDKKKKKFIKGDGVGADNVKLVRTESGARLPASYRSGRFDEWKAKSRVRLPKVGEAEGESRGRMGGGRNFRHKKVEEGKPLDPLHVGYERKARQFTKKASEKEGGNDGERPSSSQGGGRGKGGRPPPHGRGKPGVLGRKPVGKVKSEIKTVQEIHKNRKIQEKRREKNARHSKGKGKGRR